MCVYVCVCKVRALNSCVCVQCVSVCVMCVCVCVCVCVCLCVCVCVQRHVYVCGYFIAFRAKLSFHFAAFELILPDQDTQFRALYMKTYREFIDPTAKCLMQLLSSDFFFFSVC